MCSSEQLLEIESEFVFDLGKDVRVVYQSLLPELEANHHRTCSQLLIDDNSLMLKIRSNDIVSMRAALNGWLRLIKVGIDMIMTIER